MDNKVIRNELEVIGTLIAKIFATLARHLSGGKGLRPARLAQGEVDGGQAQRIYL